MSRPSIADLVESMLSTGCPPDTIVRAVAMFEASAANPAENRRKYDRDYKRRKRMEAKMSTRQKSDPLSSSKKRDSDSQLSKKEGVDLFGNLPQPADDWPEDWAEQFWNKWPRSDRKVARKQVLAKLERTRRRKEATWAHVWGGLCAYLATNPDPAWMPNVLTWVNQARWEANYDVITSRSTTKVAPARGFGAIAFGRK